MDPLCIHGHFYQPSRFDPFTETVPDEIGAAPYRNWNEKINANCYYPNAKLENFSQLSFDIGPTLWKWLERFAPETYRLIVSQEQEVFNKFGVSNCLAQPYHHTILPLGSREDKITQIRWGILDYQHRLGHPPQGIWLPETAIDDETVEILIQEGIQFTILAPWQVKNLKDNRPMLVESNNGRMIIFPFHKDISASFSFDSSKTTNADRFCDWLSKNRHHWRNGQFPIIATDGELYGHHQPFRDYFLQRLFHASLQQARIKAIFPALWLKDHVVKERAKLISNTSWSCPHGVDRWKGPCGCTSRGEWKKKLRDGLTKIAEEIDRIFVEKMSLFLTNPYILRHDYIKVINGILALSELLAQHGCTNKNRHILRTISLLLEAQTERQRMFTSCGWFFDDFARIEPVNNIKYAAKAIHLVKMASGCDLSDYALNLLKDVQSWSTNLNGGDVFLQQYKRAFKS